MVTKGTLYVEDFALGYRIEGEGPPVLVVGSETFYPRLFSDRLRGRLKLIFVDHRGFAKPPLAYDASRIDLDKVVEDIEEVRSALDLESFVILGHSGHAFMATAYARRYPDRVRKLALLHTAPSNAPERQQGSIAHFERTANPDRKRKFEADFARLPGDLEREPERRFAHMCIRMGAHSFYDYDYDPAPLWRDVSMNMPIIDHLWGERFARVDLTEELRFIDRPVFLGLGRYDYLVAPTALWDGIDERLPQVRKKIFERSGHYAMLEEPETFDEELLRWMEETN
ncbi:alpha/beta hydrolase [Paenibacillus sp.]|uniref:alpha/beta fold hydrolase n=1 Tax=Paenibacillus sp. TaxID=58172 RepID=UPI0028128DB1|nr:alpha/beta hydrolase [Paenibacillus sp.]